MSAKRGLSQEANGFSSRTLRQTEGTAEWSATGPENLGIAMSDGRRFVYLPPALQFNDGAPVTPVRAADVKQLWDAKRRMNADMPPRPNVATGLALALAYGFEAASAGPERFLPIQWRHQLMSTLVQRGVLDDYKHGEELDEKVFRAAATIPCNKEDLGETMMPLLFTQISAEDAQKAKQGMLAGGYDPNKPNVDIKFLDWLRDNC